MKKTFLLVAAFVIATLSQVVAQNSFSYQAVIRNNGEVISNKQVALRISLLKDNTSYYQETQTTTTNDYGNISINVGEGTVISGSFDAVPWESMKVMMKLEVDANGGSDFAELGTVQIRPAPYALYAAKTSTVIQSTDANSEEPIFAVKNSKGELLFAVYESGVKVYVDMDDSKAAKSRFAVAGRSASKGETVDMLTVGSDGTIVYVDDTASSKAAKSRFAVAGRSASKEGADLLAIDGEGSTFYVDGDDSKAAKSRFAVAGRSASKGEAVDMLTIDNEGTVVYVDDTANSKAAKSRFAVAGRSASKGEVSDMLKIDGEGSTFYVEDDESKAAKSRFAVAGRSASKSDVNMLTISDAGTTVYVDEATDSKAAKSRFAVAGRSASKDEAADVLSIDGNNSIFYVNSDESKAAKSRFAVAGRSASKGTADDMLAIDYVGTTVYIDEDAASKAAKSRFAIAGRSASKDSDNNNYFIVNTDSTRIYINDEAETSTGFAVVGKSTSNTLLSMKKDTVNVKTGMYVEGEMQTTSGGVTKIADDSRPTKAYWPTSYFEFGSLQADEELYNVINFVADTSMMCSYFSTDYGELMRFYSEDATDTVIYAYKNGNIYKAEITDDIVSTPQFEQINGSETYGSEGLLYVAESQLRKLGYELEPDSFEDKRFTKEDAEVASFYNYIYMMWQDVSDIKDILNPAFKAILKDMFGDMVDDKLFNIDNTEGFKASDDIDIEFDDPEYKNAESLLQSIQ